MQTVVVATARAAAKTKGANGAPRDLSALTTNIADMEASVHVTKMDPKEMEKIGRDFGLPYRLHTLLLQYKQPDKLRLSSHIRLLGDAVLITNGTLRFFDVPRFEKKVEDLEKTPSKRLTLLEYGGLLSPETLRFMQGRFVRAEPLDGHPMLVFDMTYQGVESASHYRLWIDPETRITCKREWYDTENRLRATFFYQEPREVAPGIWLPSRVEVQNADGIVAATTTLHDVKINQGLSDDLFTIKP
jgi:outer membrane lipoprotein-sorting protein